MAGNAVVIGAGIVGASVALELARRGWSVRVLEKREAVGQGSTALSSSVIRCHYTKRDAIALAFEGRHIWESWREHTRIPVPRAWYRPIGALFLLRENESGPACEGLGVKGELSQRELNERYSMMKLAGVEVMVLKGGALAQQFPFFRFPETDVVGVWEPKSGYLAYPTGAVEDLREAGEAAGVTYWLQTTVRGAEMEWVDGRRRIRKIVADTPEKTIGLDCEVVVNCAGPESAALNIDLGCPLPLGTAPLRQYIVEGIWANPDEKVPATADLVEGFYMRPDPHVFKIGAVLPPDHVDFVHAADGMADPDDATMFEAEFVERVSRRAPQIDLREVRTYVSYYDWTVSDAYPILDAMDVRGCYAAVGTSGAWFKGGPAIGALMAELVERREAGDDSTEFTLPRTGRKIDLSVFSAQPAIRSRASGR